MAFAPRRAKRRLGTSPVERPRKPPFERETRRPHSDTTEPSRRSMKGDAGAPSRSVRCTRQPTARRRCPFPPVLGILAVAGGVALLVAEVRKRGLPSFFTN